ncbi:hypothetical protein ADUPG1_005400, partial [Aduncisulcus paluster]
KKDKPCWNCRELGHYTRECTLPLKTQAELDVARNLYYTDRKAFFASKPDGRYPEQFKLDTKTPSNDKEDVMTMVNMIMAEIKSDFGNDSTTPSVLSLKTVEEIHQDEEVYDIKDDKEENEEEKMWGDWETDFDYIADRALLKYNINTGKRRKPDAPMISNADAWGLTPSGKPLTLSDEPETRKPSNREE